MKQRRPVRWGCVLGLIGVVVIVALVPIQVIVWDGGFPDIECRLRFVDSHGKPVPGVTLTVLTQAGGACYLYPVDEFILDQPVVSDAEGWMVFHHVSPGLEFSGRDYHSLLGITLSRDSAPHYDCVFSLRDREVFRTPFNFHSQDWDQFQKARLTRSWVPPAYDLRITEYLEDDRAWRLRMFDANKDGALDREERIAAACVERILAREIHRSAAHKQGDQWTYKPQALEVAFQVVERTIVIENPQ
jgi:hypothetical protein